MSFLGNVVAGATGFLRLNADDVDRGVGQANAALDRLTNISRNSYFGLRNIGVAFEAIGDAAVGAIGLATNAAMDWESSLTAVDRTNAQVTNGVITNAEALGHLHDQLTAIISVTPAGPTAVGKIAEEAGQLGIHTDDVASFTKTVVDLVTTTGANTEAAASGLARTATETGTVASQYEALGSAIEEVSRKSGANIGQVLDNTTRLAGIGTTFKLTQGDIVGVSGALAALGIQGRLGITAVTQTFTSMDTAVQNGGTHLQNFAAVAGVSIDQFKKLFKEDAANALDVFIQGLARAMQQGQDITPILQSVGITQQGSVRVLRQLVVAQADAAQTAQSLHDQIQNGNVAFSQGNALQQQAARFYATTSSELKTLHSDVTIAAISFGSLFLPALRFVAGVLQNVALGLAALPTWARAALAVITALAAGVGVLGGAMLLLLPRFLIARDTLLQLAVATRAQAEGQGAVAATTAATVSPMAALVGMMQELVAIQLVLIGEYETLPEAMAATEAGMAGYAGESVGVVAANIAETASIGILEAAWITLQAAMGPIGWLMLGITAAALALVAILGSLGKQHKDAANAAIAHAQADQSLLTALQGEASAVKAATAAWIVNKLAMDGTLTTLQKMGVSTSDVIALVQGTLPQNKIRQIADELEKAGNKGDEGAKKAVKSLLDATSTYAATTNAENSLVQARKEGAIAATGEAAAIDESGNSNLTAAQKAEKAGQAARNYASDLLNEKQAAFQVKDAQLQLADAADKLANKQTILANAQDDVLASQANELVAADKLTEAQRELDRARKKAQDDLDDAIRKQESDELSVQRALNQRANAQAALNKLMDPKESAEKLTDATNALKDAQLGLVDSEQAVSDAQWYVNYLMGEGASQRDIRDAQNALAKAQQKVADQTDKVGDSQRALDDLTNNGESARKQADAELALREAEFGVVDAQHQLADQQQIVIDKRADVTNDVAYHQALENERQAQKNVQQAHLDTATALTNLHAIQGGSLEENFAKAQLGVEQALISQATAITDTKQDWDAMHGTFWDTRRYAQELGTELIKLGGTASGTVKTDLTNMGTQVRYTANYMGDLKDKTHIANDELSKVGPNAAGAINTLSKANDDLNKHAGFWQSLGDKIHDVSEFFTGGKSSGWLGGLKDVLMLANPVTTPFELAKKGWELFGHDEGGLFTKPHLGLVAEAGPELILPLNDPSRMTALLESSGVMDMLAGASRPAALATVGGGGGTIQHIDQSKTVHQGDFNAEINGYTDIDAAMRDWSWKNRIMSRSA